MSLPCLRLFSLLLLVSLVLALIATWIVALIAACIATLVVILVATWVVVFRFRFRQSATQASPAAVFLEGRVFLVRIL